MKLGLSRNYESDILESMAKPQDFNQISLEVSRNKLITGAGGWVGLTKDEG